MLRSMDENELARALERYMPENEPSRLKVGEHKPFKPFKPIAMKGEGPTASEMVVQDRS